MIMLALKSLCKNHNNKQKFVYFHHILVRKHMISDNLDQQLIDQQWTVFLYSTDYLGEYSATDSL